MLCLTPFDLNIPSRAVAFYCQHCVVREANCITLFFNFECIIPGRVNNDV